MTVSNIQPSQFEATADLISPKGSRQMADSFAMESNMRKDGLLVDNQKKLPLQYVERNLIKLIDPPDQLTGIEKEQLQQLIRQEQVNYKEQASTRFDSDKNWSIMIRSECNDERNEIMRRFKYQQLKRHKLHEFTRKQRERIISERPSAIE